MLTLKHLCCVSYSITIFPLFNFIIIAIIFIFERPFSIRDYQTIPGRQFATLSIILFMIVVEKLEMAHRIAAVIRPETIKIEN